MSTAVKVATGAGILTGRPSVAAPRTTTAPSIDGRLDDPVWRTAARITDFVQQRPLEGVPATEPTDVYIAYDSRNLYFGIYAHYSDLRLIRANRVDRDQTGRDDQVSLLFDRYKQGRLISETLFPTTEYERTNLAFFTKLQYLFRY